MGKKQRAGTHHRQHKIGDIVRVYIKPGDQAGAHLRKKFLGMVSVVVNRIPSGYGEYDYLYELAECTTGPKNDRYYLFLAEWLEPVDLDELQAIIDDAEVTA